MTANSDKEASGIRKQEVTRQQTQPTNLIHNEEPMIVPSAPLYVAIGENDDDLDPDATAERRQYVGPLWKCWLLSSGTCFFLLLWPALAMALMGGMMLFDDPFQSSSELRVGLLIYYLLVGFPIVLLVSMVTMCRGYVVGRRDQAVRCSFVPVGWFAVIVAMWLLRALLSKLFPM